MQTQNVTFLLAVNTFALISLIMVFGSTRKPAQNVSRRLLIALFALVLLRSTYLLNGLWYNTLSTPFVGTIETLSLLCIVWALLNRSTTYHPRWQQYRWLVIFIVVGLCGLLWFFPGLAWQWIALGIAGASYPLIVRRQTEMRWSHIMTPSIIGIAALTNWAGLMNLSQFLTLLGYGTLNYAIYTSVAFNAKARQQEVKLLGTETQRQYAEQSYFMEISRRLNSVNQPAEQLSNAAATIGQSTNVDQVVILGLEKSASEVGQVAVVHNRNQLESWPHNARIQFLVADYPLLVEARDLQRPIIPSLQEDTILLYKLCALWQNDQMGPMLIQPLYLGDKLTGFLILSNKSETRPIHSNHVRLCQKLGPQLAALVVFQQEYETLEKVATKLAGNLDLERKSSEQFSSIVDTIQHGIIASDTEGRIYLVNKTAEALLGQSRARLLGKSLKSLYSKITSQKPIERLAIEFSRSNQAIPVCLENDKGRDIAGQLIPLRNSRQEWLGIVAIIQNTQNSSLPAPVVNNNHNEFWGMFTKEIKASLSIIDEQLEIMLSSTANDDLSVQQQHFLEVIQSSLNRAVKVVEKGQRVVQEEHSPL